MSTKLKVLALGLATLFGVSTLAISAPPIRPAKTTFIPKAPDCITLSMVFEITTLCFGWGAAHG